LAGDSERGFVVEAVVKRGDVAWLKIMVFSCKKPFGSTPVPVYTPQSPALVPNNLHHALPFSFLSPPLSPFQLR